MIDRLIGFSLRQRPFIAGMVATILAVGVWALATLPFEAFPDLTANSVTVIAEAPALAPQEVEQLVTFPIERSMLGLPNTEAVRSTTKFGLSITQIIFEDGVDQYFARQLVAQRLGDASRMVPPGVTPVLGPIATAMGEVFQYVLTSESPEWDATSLKTLQDFTIAPQLRTVPGVTEVNSWGGYIEQYHVVIDPRRLGESELTLGEVEAAIAENNGNFGGAYTENRGERYIIVGLGRIDDLNDLAQVTIATRDGVPIRLGDFADVRRGAFPRQGAVTFNGRGEVVSGMVMMRKGENARRVIVAIKERVGEIVGTLPPGVVLTPFYDQTELVDRTTHTITTNLSLGAALVVLLLWVFLRSIAASLIVAAVIPLSMLWAFIAMRVFGYSANLMSLGALDFGLLVDGSLVIMENIMRRSGEPTDTGDSTERIRSAVVEVGRPVVFGIAIIMAVYLPVFALEGTERKMFVPMGFTVVAAVLGSLLLAVTAVPAAARTFLANTEVPPSAMMIRAQRLYRVLLRASLRRSTVVIGAAALLIVLTVPVGVSLGREFMPRLDEGSVLVQTRRLPSTSLQQGISVSRSLERALLGLPEVRSVVSKLGRPDLATEAMGTYESDSYVALKERSEWRPGGKDALIAVMDSALQTVPGISYAFTQPIQMRLDEAESGITTDVGVKIFGNDQARLAELARRAEVVLVRIPGAADVKAIAASDMRHLQIDLDRELLSRHGIASTAAGAEVERALGASIATQVIDGPRRIGVAVRIPEASVFDPTRIGELPIPTGSGDRVLLSAIADISIVERPEAFAHEGGQRLVVVGANIRGRDVGGFVTEASEQLEALVPLPEGYRYEWGGQYRNQQTALRRLSFVVPFSVLTIFLLLFTAFGTVRHAALIMTNVPFAAVGGVAGLWITGLNLSLSASIGFIALFGIASLNGVVLVSYINELREKGQPLEDAVLNGASTRLRSVLMTALVPGMGFLPMAVSTLPGAELQRPLATVVIFGLISSTLLTLLVQPTLYREVERWGAGHVPDLRDGWESGSGQTPEPS